MKIKSFLFFAVLLFSAAAVNAETSLSAEDLSLREQVGQTIMPRVVIGRQKQFKKAVLNGEVTGFFVKANEGLITHPEITAENQKRFIAKQRKKLLKTIRDLKKWAAKSPHGIPLLLAYDYEGGTVTSPMYLGLKQMPSNMLLAATGHSETVYEMYAAQAREILLTGANAALGPVADVNSNPLNPIIQTRSFGDKAQRVGFFAASAVRGLEDNGVPSFLKHFPGHGDTSSDSHYTQPVTALPPQQLWQEHISAFQPAVDVGATGILSAHVVYPLIDKENSAMFSTKIMKELLRGKMGFGGIAVTDGLDMGAVKGVSLEEIIRRSYNGGNNILLLSGDVRDEKTARDYPARAADYVEKAVKGNPPEVSADFIKESAQKVLDLKKHLGLFNERNLSGETGFAQAAQKAAEEGVTLVRDTQKAVPLSEETKTVCAVFFADGIFSTQLKTFTDTLSEGGKTVRAVYAPRTPAKKDLELAFSCAAEAETVVIGSSRASAMDERQQKAVGELLDKTAKAGRTAILVSLLNPYEIPLYPQAETVFALYGPTAEAAHVCAKILLGELPARGRLPIKL